MFRKLNGLYNVDADNRLLDLHDFGTTGLKSEAKQLLTEAKTMIL
jgi:hypothetical protein